jgi:pimeloyl-ACP methyl ester carboxylesterase/DNA-binding SARP family transcriptional activator
LGSTTVVIGSWPTGHASTSKLFCYFNCLWWASLGAQIAQNRRRDDNAMSLGQTVETVRPDAIEIRVVGDFAVYRGGELVTLPQSKKTRCLLAYLAVVERPQRRERLCEMFWEVPDDPRGALRWSLSKVRQIVGDALEASRETVHLNTGQIDLDYRQISRAMSGDLSALDTGELERITTLCRGPFLADLALPRCPEYEAWRTSLANELEVMQVRLRRLLIDRLRSEPQRALVHAHALRAMHPHDNAIAAEAAILAQEARRQPLDRAAETPPPLKVAPPIAASASADHQETSFVGEVNEKAESRPAAPVESPHGLQQKVHFCMTSDNVRIAYALAGQGLPLVKAANWLNHLEYDWQSPIWSDLLHALAAEYQLIRYDERGNGLSDWNVDDISFEAFVRDLASVVDATGLQRFTLLGISQGCAVSIAYAVRHPERVSHLVLYGGYARGRRKRGSTEEIEASNATLTLMRLGWGQDNPAFRHIFTSLFIPDGTAEQMKWFDDLQRVTTSAENAFRIRRTMNDIDVSDLLERVSVPTLVAHCNGDAVVPFEEGRLMASRIPGARFVALESRNHLILPGEPALGRFLDAIRDFLKS